MFSGKNMVSQILQGLGLVQAAETEHWVDDQIHFLFWVKNKFRKISGGWGWYSYFFFCFGSKTNFEKFQIFFGGRGVRSLDHIPQSGSKAEDGEEKKRKRKKERLNNGKATHGARKPPGPIELNGFIFPCLSQGKAFQESLTNFVVSVFVGGWLLF